MRVAYSLKDIHNFLSQKYVKFDWDYEIYDRRGIKRRATIEDFTNDIYDTVSLVFIYRRDEYNLDVQVTNFSFVVYEDEPNIMGSGSTTKVRDNFTSEWVSFLLDRYGARYAKSLLRYSEIYKKQIKEDAEREIASYANKVQIKAKQRASHYENLAQKAKQFLSTTEVAEAEQEFK